MFAQCDACAQAGAPASRSVTIVAKAAHVTLYVLLLLLPLSGWLMVTSTPVRVPTIVFGLFELPYPLAPDIARFRLAHAAQLFSRSCLPRLSFSMWRRGSFTPGFGATAHSGACGCGLTEHCT